MNDKLQKIYMLANSYRGIHQYDFNELIKLALENDIDLTYEDIYTIQKKHSKYSFGLIPKIVSEFMDQVITEEIDVLVPWNTYGELIDGISSNVKNSVLLTENESCTSITNKMLINMNFENIFGNTLNTLDELKEGNFDLIGSFPPMGMMAETEYKNASIKAELAHLIILKSSKLLKEDGKMFFIVNQSFFKRIGKKAVLPLLEKNGIYLDAAFYLPPGTHTHTGIGTYLIVLSRKKHDYLFVSELTQENNEKVVSNWTKRKESKILRDGHLIKHETFFSYETLDKEMEINKIVKRADLVEEPLKNYANEINSLPRKAKYFTEHENSVYLPNIGLSDAVNAQNDMKNKPQNYFQIVLKSEVNAVYLAKWFNTELGLLLRESLMTGITIQKINKSTLEDSSIYLPEKKVQQEVLNIQSKVDEFKNELLSIQDKAWNYPNSHENLSKKLEKLNREEGFAEWVETLPFPIASILYKYFATTDVANKKDYLLHFFEAFAQFQAVLMMSAYAKNSANLDEKYLYEIDSEKLSRATFGTWVYIGRGMTKKIRQLLNDNSEHALRLFQHKRKSFIETITSKKVYNILENTNKYRNDWKGHGGVESKQEAKNRLGLLEKELNLLRQAIGDVYEGYLLIKPGTGHFKSELYNCNCKLLKGTRATFKEKNIEVIKGLDIESLYFLEEESYEPLEILPFIKIMPSPSTQVNACYFYNRLDPGGVRMVSYYFDQDADVTIQDTKLESIISNINIT